MSPVTEDMLSTGTEPADMPRTSEASWLDENGIAAAIHLPVLSWYAARHYNDFQTYVLKLSTTQNDARQRVLYSF